ncbi:MAG: polyphosphate:AMP phosphotransferase [Myxococcales bacterium]|nr:polyphosphate:AMP phosphotransferase [Myxococcales bacterium]
MSFEDAERGEIVTKDAYDARAAELRVNLLDAQYQALKAAKFPVVIVVAGVDGASKSEVLAKLTEWMDPRHVHAHAVGLPSDEELERPPMWRFWRRLPPKGKTGIFFGSWYTQPIIERVERKMDIEEFETALGVVQRFERMIAAEGALVLKFWFHLSKKDQRKRLDTLAASKKTAWRVSKEEWRRFQNYDRFRKISNEALALTTEPPWQIVDGRDWRTAALTVGDAVNDALRIRLESIAENEKAAKAEKADRAEKADKKPKKLRAVAKTQPLSEIDLTKKLDDEEYDEQLLVEQRRLALLTRNKRYQKLSPLIVFEGMDAAGKGGAVRRLTAAMDARQYIIVPVAAPTDEERAQPYLWRFWRHAPPERQIAIFDRSWYGRVLVERVEGFCGDAEWRRAFDEINDFEAQLASAANIVVKLWLQVSPDEQLRRFKEREDTPFKRFKITAEDWRNRERLADYQVAANDMLAKTSTVLAPWTVVEADDKRWARIKVLRTVADAIERRL